jgi:hypothetical protein
MRTVLVADQDYPLIWVEDRLVTFAVVLRWAAIVLIAGVVLGVMFR